MQLDIPNFGVVATASREFDPTSSFTHVARSHAEFKAAIHPELSRDDGFYKACTAEVNAISLFFPDIEAEGIRIVFTAWLAFACSMDDILETLESGYVELVLTETVTILRNYKSPSVPKTPPVRHAMLKNRQLSLGLSNSLDPLHHGPRIGASRVKHGSSWSTVLATCP